LGTKDGTLYALGARGLAGREKVAKQCISAINTTAGQLKGTQDYRQGEGKKNKYGKKVEAPKQEGENEI